MKKFIKKLFYFLLLYSLLYPLWLPLAALMGYVILPVTLKEFIGLGITIVITCTTVSLYMTMMPKKGDKKIKQIEENFKYLIDEFNFTILDKEVLNDVIEYIQLIYINDSYKITISYGESIRIIIQNAKTLAVYCDKKEFFDDYQTEHSYKEILNVSTKWLYNELISKFHTNNQNSVL